MVKIMVVNNSLSFHYKPISNCQELKLLAKEGALKAYYLFINLFSKALRLCNVSFARLDKHVFKIKILCKYERLKSINRVMCDRFKNYLKVPMLNTPKIDVILKENYLQKAQEYQNQFFQDCETNFDKWYEKALDAYLISDAVSTEMVFFHRKIMSKKDSKIRIEQRNLLSHIGPFMPHHSGVCFVVVANIFNKLKKNNTSSLAHLVAKYKKGVGKKLTGLTSFGEAMWKSWASLEKSILSSQAFASQEGYFFHILNRLNVTQEIIDQVNEKYTDNFNQSIQKINELKDACYHLRLMTQEDDNKIGIHHALFLRKQGDQLEIIDPNIGLLESHNHEETKDLLPKLLEYYVKKNQLYWLFIYQMS